MRLSFRPVAVVAAVGSVVFALTAAAWWYVRPQPYDTVRRADRLTVYEGLPHPLYEEEAFRGELKAARTAQLCGFPFYREPLELKDEDARALRDLLGDASTYRAYSGEKKCGGFHPDYAVEWPSSGEVDRALICFGCSEVRIIRSRGGTFFYDLRRGRDRRPRLLDLLKAYRKNRPPHERFGLTPVPSG